MTKLNAMEEEYTGLTEEINKGLEDKLEAEIFNLTKRLMTVLQPGGSINDLLRPAPAVELARCAKMILGVLAHGEMPEEDFSELPDDPQVMGHFTLQAFGVGDETFGLARKQKLMEVAIVLGRDNLESLRRDVAFMIKVEGFK